MIGRPRARRSGGRFRKHHPALWLLASLEAGIVMRRLPPWKTPHRPGSIRLLTYTEHCMAWGGGCHEENREEASDCGGSYIRMARHWGTVPSRVPRFAAPLG